MLPSYRASIVNLSPRNEKINQTIEHECARQQNLSSFFELSRSSFQLNRSPTNRNTGLETPSVTGRRRLPKNYYRGEMSRFGEFKVLTHRHPSRVVIGITALLTNSSRSRPQPASK
jgi:hypothetical protein